MNEPNFSILVAGDTVPTKSIEALLVMEDESSLLSNSLYDSLQQAVLSPINLECPLTISDTPIENDSPNLKAFPETIERIETLNPSVIGLADNHILYKGGKGFADILSLLSEFGISYVSVGNCLSKVLQTKNLLVKILESAFEIVNCGIESIDD